MTIDRREQVYLADLMTMKLYSLCILLLFVLAFQTDAQTQQSSAVFNVKDFGALGDGSTINTEAFNKAVEVCADAGGGTVAVPAGTYLTGTIHMKSHVTLLLEKDSILKGTADLDAYMSYVPTSERDMKKYDTAYRTRWNRALILGVGVNNAAIVGAGEIDGDHVFDAQGEERMRGPHTILFAESRNLTFNGFTVKNSSNYAFLGYEIENVVFSNMTFKEGWDGTHIRGGKNIIIRNSSFFTGDDAIAGGYWENVVITDCRINSSCNGIRIIMPSENLTISHCIFAGPGRYPHRTSRERQRTNMLSAILLQPGGWVAAPGFVDKIHIHDVAISNMNNPFMFVLNGGNNAGKILVERVKAMDINAHAVSIESWKGGMFDEVIFRDISIEYVGQPNASSSDASLRQPPADSRPLPCWAWFVRNVKSITLENVDLRYTGTDPRPAFYFDNVFAVNFNGVKYPGSGDLQTAVFKNSGKWLVEEQEVQREPTR